MQLTVGERREDVILLSGLTMVRAVQTVAQDSKPELGVSLVSLMMLTQSLALGD